MRLFQFSAVHKLQFWSYFLPEYIRLLRLRRRHSSHLLQPAGSSLADMDFQQSFLHSCRMRFRPHFQVSDLGFLASWTVKVAQWSYHMPSHQFPWHHRILGTAPPGRISLCVYHGNLRRFTCRILIEITCSNVRHYALI